MDFLDKWIKRLGVAIAGLSVVIVVMLCKKGFIKLPEFMTPKEPQGTEEEIDPNLHRELIDNYQEYVDSIANEIKQVGRDGSILDVFAVYEYLEDNGLISLGDDFTHGTVDFEIADNYGVNVATGSGLSRNQLDNFMNIAEALGHEVHLVNGSLYTEGDKTSEVNHCVCYAVMNGHTVLIDPANRTIFLKDGGVYRSVDKDYLVFKADRLYDQEVGNYPDNKDFYNSLENTYSNTDIPYEFPVKREAIKEYADFFADYELANLIEYEQFISDYIDECSKNEENKQNNKGLTLEGE